MSVRATTFPGGSCSKSFSSFLNVDPSLVLGIVLTRRRLFGASHFKISPIVYFSSCGCLYWSAYQADRRAFPRPSFLIRGIDAAIDQQAGRQFRNAESRRQLAHSIVRSSQQVPSRLHYRSLSTASVVYSPFSFRRHSIIQGTTPQVITDVFKRVAAACENLIPSVILLRMAKFEILGELSGFIWARKLWWIVPITVFLLFVGILLVFSESSAVAPFIYALF